MEPRLQEVNAGEAPRDAEADLAPMVLGVHVDLAAYNISCPNCGKSLELMSPERGEVRDGVAPTGDGYGSTIARPEICPHCGKVVVFGL